MHCSVLSAVNALKSGGTTRTYILQRNCISTSTIWWKIRTVSYRSAFLTEQVAKTVDTKAEDNPLWSKVKEILKYQSAPEVTMNTFLIR